MIQQCYSVTADTVCVTASSTELGAASDTASDTADTADTAHATYSIVTAKAMYQHRETLEVKMVV